MGMLRHRGADLARSISITESDTLAHSHVPFVVLLIQVVMGVLLLSLVVVVVLFLFLFLFLFLLCVCV